MRRLAMLLVLAISSVSASEIAVVIRTSGDVTKTSDQSTQSTLKRRDTLAEGDSVTTGIGANATLKFSDETIIDVAERSTLLISEFEIAGNEQKPKIILELLSGQLRTITGSTAKTPGAFELRTAHASIGVRGTEFEVHRVSEQQTMVHWHEGVVLVHSLEFPEQIVELTEQAQAASVTLGSPAQLIPANAGPRLGPFGAELLAQIAAIPAPIILPIVPVAIPAVVALDSDGATAVSELENEEPMRAFISLVRQQQWPAARIMANELSDRFEGLPRFDLYHGILLMAEQHYDEAIFSFERVLLFSPDQHRARLELGRAYYLTQNYERAINALDQVLAAKPPAAVKAKVEVLLTRINEAQRRTQSRPYISGGVLAGWDSNYNSGQNVKGKFDFNKYELAFGEPIYLSEDRKPKDSAYSQFSINTGQIIPTSQNSNSQLNFDFTQRQYRAEDANNTQALTLGGSFNQQKNRWRSRLPASLQWSRLNNENWQATAAVSLSYQYQAWGPLWAGVKIGTQMAASLNSANTSSVKDSAGIIFDAQEREWSHTFVSQYLQLTVAEEEDGQVKWRGIANQYQLAWSLPRNWQINIAAEHQWHRYKEKDPIFFVNSDSTELKIRQDHLFTAGLQASWAPKHWLQTQTHVNWEGVISNINAYSRDRTTVSQLLSIRF